MAARLIWVYNLWRAESHDTIRVLLQQLWYFWRKTFPLPDSPIDYSSLSNDICKDNILQILSNVELIH